MRRANSAVLRVFVGGAVMGLLVPAARAELVELTASVEAESEQIVDGQQDAFELAFEAFPTTTNVLPQEAEVALHFEENGLTVAQGNALAIFTEPELDASGNPGEVGASGAAFSTSSRAHHVVKCLVEENRIFFFSSEEAGEPDGTEIQVTSTLFPTGGLVIWGEPGTNDLTGASVNIAFTIVQERQGTETTLATVSADLVGQSDGTATLTVDANVNGLPFSISAPLGSPTGILAGRSGGQGELPEIPIDFTYSAIVGEGADAELTLKATVEGECTNGPGGGVGAAFVLGGPLFDSSDTSSRFARLINDTVTRVAPARPTIGSSPLGVLGNLCGTLGVETALLAMFLGVTCAVRSRSRRFP